MTFSRSWYGVVTIALSATLLLMAGTNAQAREDRLASWTAEVSMKTARIRNAQELEQFLNTAGEDSVINKMTPVNQAEFISSLVFGENGLGSFRYTGIVEDLTYSEAYQLMAVFGRSDVVSTIPGLRVISDIDKALKKRSDDASSAPEGFGKNYMDYTCIGRATCRIRSRPCKTPATRMNPHFCG